MRKLTIIFIIFSFLCGAQSRIQNFNVFPAGSSVGIKFTITKGAQCSGYAIWYSLDSINFNQIYNYPGVCGDVNTDQDISYTHSSPAINQTNYYKVELIPVETSPIKRVYVNVAPKVTLRAFPDPLVNTYDQLNLKLSNTINARVVGFFYNQFGKPIRDLDLTTQIDLATVNVNDLSNGLYAVWLTDGTAVYTCKFIINR